MGEGKVESVRPGGEIPAGFSAMFTCFSRCLGESPHRQILDVKESKGLIQLWASSVPQELGDPQGSAGICA